MQESFASLTPQERKAICKAIRGRGFTIAGWARISGFNEGTVYQLLMGSFIGSRGDESAAIFDKLKKDGFIPPPTGQRSGRKRRQ